MTESTAQIQIATFVRLYTDLPFIHIPNEGVRTKSNGARLKAMGMYAGASDIFIPRAIRGYHGLFIELKTGKNKLTPNQKNFLDRMDSEGYKAVACWGATAAIETIIDFYKLTQFKK